MKKVVKKIALNFVFGKSPCVDATRNPTKTIQQPYINGLTKGRASI